MIKQNHNVTAVYISFVQKLLKTVLYQIKHVDTFIIEIINSDGVYTSIQ